MEQPNGVDAMAETGINVAEVDGGNGADGGKPSGERDLVQLERGRLTKLLHSKEAEWQTELQTRQQRIDELEAAEKERERAGMDEQTRLRTDLEETQKAYTGLQSAVTSLSEQLASQQRSGRIAELIAGSTVRIPRRYVPGVYERLAQVEEVTPEVVDLALQETFAEWQADSETLLPKGPPPPNVGSAGAPPGAAPQRTATEADLEAAEAALYEGVRRRDPKSIAEAQRRYAR